MGVSPPSHVLSAFQVDGQRAEPVDAAWGRGSRFGRTVVARANATSAWSGKMREKLSPVPGLRIARPVRATDGRLIVGGFKADEFHEGEALGRVDACVAASLLYDEALSASTTPPPGGAAEVAMSWARVDQRVWRGYVPQRGDVVAHLDFLACLVFPGDEDPVLTDLVPSVGPRPRGFTAALVIVDGLLAELVDDAVMDRWAHIPSLPALVTRALDFRSAAPRGPGESNVSSTFQRVARLVSD